MTYEGDVEKLEKQRAKLQVKEDFRKASIERNQKKSALKSEIRKMKYKRTYAVAGALSSGIKRTAKGFAQNQKENRAMQMKKFKGKRRTSRAMPRPTNQAMQRGYGNQRGVGEIAIDMLI